MIFGTLASTISVYDISKKPTTTCGSGDNSHIYGSKVLWLNTDTTSGQSKLVLYDLSSQKTTNVTSGSTNVGSFDMYGDNIVYVNKSSSSDLSGLSDYSDITSIIGNIGSTGSTGSTGGVPCIYSISKGKVAEMANETQAGNIDIYSNTIVWDTPPSGSNITVYKAASSSSSSSSSSKVTKPVAAFKANKVSGTHPLAVTFTYTGTGGTPDSYTWNFNDKTSTVTTASKTVTHTFKNKGTYTICCTAKNKAGSNTATKTKYITVK
jgi:PKD repeat protein